MSCATYCSIINSWFSQKQTKYFSVTIMAIIVVVFDFDKTIIECDSDNWVVDELGFNDLFNQLFPIMPLNYLMVSL